MSAYNTARKLIGAASNYLVAEAVKATQKANDTADKAALLRKQADALDVKARGLDLESSRMSHLANKLDNLIGE